ncbi:putative RNA exonuclease 1 like protein [Blattamonas nauphoetae]|uniref:RNA exonuclease 1 like protein n=1 Tax=Blattamonas nauphoetae TaxID=2049346 RepID=A0ABQ9Y6J8_9EUKA|nr:putative RNA exonuclease 1 like protein [Blattamonas nauphoetae]
MIASHPNLMAFNTVYVSFPPSNPTNFEKQIFLPTFQHIRELVPRINKMRKERPNSSSPQNIANDPTPPRRDPQTWKRSIQRRNQFVFNGIDATHQDAILEVVLSEREMHQHGFPIGVSGGSHTQQPIFVFMAEEWEGDGTQKLVLLMQKRQTEEQFKREMLQLIESNTAHFSNKPAQKAALLNLLKQPGCMACIGDSLLDLPVQPARSFFQYNPQDVLARQTDGNAHTNGGASSMFVNTHAFFDACLTNEEKQTLTFYPLVGLDCEMVEVRIPRSQCSSHAPSLPPLTALELARVTLVDDQMRTILDALCVPDGEVVDFLTDYSGITREMLFPPQSASNRTGQSEERRVPVVTKAGYPPEMLVLFPSRRALRDHILRRGIIQPDTVLVGHSIENDLFALKLSHDLVADTSVLYPHRLGLPLKNSLRSLAQRHLHYAIQEDTHNSREDACASLRLVLLCAQAVAQGKPIGMALLQKETTLRLSVLDCHITAVVDRASYEYWNFAALKEEFGRPPPIDMPRPKPKTHPNQIRISDIENTITPRRGWIDPYVTTTFESTLYSALYATEALSSRTNSEPLPFLFVRLDTSMSISRQADSVPSWIRDVDVGIELLIQRLPPNSLVVLLCGPCDPNQKQERGTKRDFTEQQNDPSNRGTALFFVTK